MVIEAVFEELSLKHKVLKEVEAVSEGPAALSPGAAGGEHRRGLLKEVEGTRCSGAIHSQT